jgi:site-specific DNA-methyltransferase (adenine-specific)
MLDVELYQGDCLEVMKRIEDGRVDAVICDPPYGNMDTDGGRKLGITGWDSALAPSAFLGHCNRILRPNGAVILFSQEPYSSRLVLEAHGSIPFAYRMTWLKDNFANALGVNKAPVSFSEDILVFFKAFDSFLGHPLKPWFDAELKASGMTRKEAVQRWGSSASHYFTDGRQFMIPSADRLAVMQADTGRFQMAYDEMKAITDKFRAETRERFPKVFNLPEGQKYKSNVLQYRKDYTGHHPTQKPVALIEDLVKTYTNPGDTVLDFTMGSGSTGVACVNTGRKFIGIERDTNYFAVAQSRIRPPDDLLAALPLLTGAAC